MNPDANNETPGPSFDFDAAEQEFEDVELPPLERELGPAERQIARQIGEQFEILEMILRATLVQVEALREIDFEEIMKDPELVESACGFSEVATQLPNALAAVAAATLAARYEFGKLDQQDDLPEAA